MVAKRDQGGFTLIELLIVIIILAILAAIVVFAVGNTNTNAIASSCNADAKSVETALEAYKAQIDFVPAGRIGIRRSHDIHSYVRERRQRDGGTMAEGVALDGQLQH